MDTDSRTAVQIRNVRPSELTELGRLTVAGYRSDGFVGETDGTEHYAAELADTASRARQADLLVAVGRGDELLGTVTWCPPGSSLREVARRPDQGEFRMLTVSPAARGRGVGRALVGHCLRQAHQLDLAELVLSSRPMMAAAHRLYRSFGFDRAPELDWSPVPEVLLWGFRLALPADVGAATLSPARPPAPDR